MTDRILNGAPRTRSEDVFQQLSRDIVLGKFEPGSKLAANRLQKLYDVGISPLREALSRLSAVGLVTQMGQYGFRVVSTSADDLIDITRMRVWAECMALRLAIDAGDADWEADILAAAHRLRGEQKFVSPGELSEKWEQKHRLLHATLVKACGSAHLLSYRERLYDLSDRYRRFSMLVAPEINTSCEHEEIVGAVISRNAKVASAKMEGHLFNTAEIILRRALGLDNARDRLIEAIRPTIRRSVSPSG